MLWCMSEKPALWAEHRSWKHDQSILVNKWPLDGRTSDRKNLDVWNERYQLTTLYSIEYKYAQEEEVNTFSWLADVDSCLSAAAIYCFNHKSFLSMIILMSPNVKTWVQRLDHDTETSSQNCRCVTAGPPDCIPRSSSAGVLRLVLNLSGHQQICGSEGKTPADAGSALWVRSPGGNFNVWLVGHCIGWLLICSTN